MIQITKTVQLDENELQFDMIRGSGPGGQNVNKVATAVQLRLDLPISSLPTEIKTRLYTLAGNRITKEGTLIIEARRFRTQEQNRQDAINRLKELIKKAAVKPKSRKVTQPTAAAKTRRLKAKQKRSKIKQFRRAVNQSEE